MKHFVRLSTMILLVACAAGCNTFTVKTPAGFVSLERYRSKTYYKAVSPDNAVITISAFPHRDKGTLNFWASIVRREMTLQKGYAHKGTKAVRSQSGLEGRRLRFTARNGTTPFVYEATLFVTSRYIYVIEAAAKAKKFQAHRSSLDALVASFRGR